MSYQVIHAFVDLLDGGFLYKFGDAYPRKGYAPTEARIKELSGKNNKQHKPLIKAVEVVEAEAEVAKPAKKKRGKKNENN